ncbi:MAG: hypothetical protein KC933_27375 [Myxococcales bacterium]|nr:hypothetical protein [Myxococcales bacterium]MCB9648307.1 hypothetical protein [Deltaproteobacteria bacterium]
MSPTSNHGAKSFALSRDRQDDDEAEIIDLVHLPRGTRPTPIAYLDFEEVERLRVMSCGFYQDCLTFAAEVKWRSFHCKQCPENPARAGLGREDPALPDSNAAVIKLH